MLRPSLFRSGGHLVQVSVAVLCTVQGRGILSPIVMKLLNPDLADLDSVSANHKFVTSTLQINNNQTSETSEIWSNKHRLRTASQAYTRGLLLNKQSTHHMIPKTPTKGAARKEDTISPDPLAMQNKSISDEEEDMIVIPSRNPPSSKKLIAGATSLRKRKAQQSDDELQEPDEKPIKRTKRIDVTVEIPLLNSRSRNSPRPDNRVDLPTTPRKVGRPRKDTPQTARASSSRSKPVPTTEEQVRTPSTRVRKPTAKAREGSSTPRAKTVLPTTPKKVKTRAEHPESGPGSGSGSSDDSSEEDDEDNFKLDDEHSRAKFLHNERRRKANQARNFVYTGDATEKRRLRNGKAVQEEEESVPDDMPADDERILYQEAGFQVDGDGIDSNMDVEMDYTYIPETMVLPEIPLSAPSSIHKASTLSTYARTALNEILTRISAPTSRNPPPFATEGPENEALTNLVNLLRGTVERGEGNSCLVVGSKGSGKTRVSWNAQGTCQEEPQLNRTYRL
jgi:origin recognition complex subunit 4